MPQQFWTTARRLPGSSSWRFGYGDGAEVPSGKYDESSGPFGSCLVYNRLRHKYFTKDCSYKFFSICTMERYYGLLYKNLVHSI